MKRIYCLTASAVWRPRLFDGLGRSDAGVSCV